MARIKGVSIKGYRSINEAIHLTIPVDGPLILVGANNSGKSNIVRAVELILGEFWPSNYEPEDHEFYDRQRVAPITIAIDFQETDKLGGSFEQVVWHHNPLNIDEPTLYKGRWRRGSDDGSRLNKEQRETCICMVVGADRELSYQLSYRNKWTFLSKLMRKFHEAMLRKEGTKAQLEALFEEIKGKFDQVEEFSQFMTNLKTDFDDMVGSMTHRLEIDFQAYNPANYFNALQLHAMEGENARTLEELGTGEEQVLSMAFAHAYAKAFHGGVVLIIEEPEAHLHPLAQQWLAKKIQKMAKDGLQIIITTHSPSFLDILSLDGIVRVHKADGATQITQVNSQHLINRCLETGVPATRINLGNVLPFYAASSTDEILKGFFASKIVLVEGPTESLALPIYLQKVGLDLLKKDIALVPVLGKGNIAKWWRLFTAFDIPTYVIFDNDPDDDKIGNKRRDFLNALGIEVTADIIGLTKIEINQNYTVFGLGFEAALRRVIRNYEQLEEQAIEFIGSESKPLIARSVAETIELSLDNGLEIFQKLAEAIDQHLGT